VATLLLVGGPAVATVTADPGGSGSHSGRSDDDGRSDSRDGGSSHGGSEWGDNHDGDSNGGGSDYTAPKTRVGSGREPGESPSINGSDSSDRSGSDHTAGAPAPFEPPKVTFGNGRTPGVQDDSREPRWRGGASEAEPPPPPPPPPVYVAPAPSWVDRLTAPPRVPQQLAVAPAAGWRDPIFGLAGLLLIPAAGAVLGYRQARAAQDVEKLHRP